MGFVLVGAGWDWDPRALSDSFLSEHLHSRWEVCCCFRLCLRAHTVATQDRGIIAGVKSLGWRWTELDSSPALKLTLWVTLVKDFCSAL